MDSTLHVMTVNLEMLAAVSSTNMPASSKIDQWLSGICHDSLLYKCSKDDKGLELEVIGWVLNKM